MSRRTLAIAAALAGALLGVAGMTLAGGGEQERGAGASRWQAPDRSFAITVPPDWKVEHGVAATVLQRADGRGTLVVRRGGRLRGSVHSLARGLGRSLRRELGDVKPLPTSTLTTGGREGLLYTFTRPAAGTVQSVAVIPTADGSYTLDAVVSGADGTVAAQLGAMVRSFAPAA